MSELPAQGQELLVFLEHGVEELRRLWPSGSRVAIQSIGYALHNFPSLIRSGRVFDPKSFEFCFRIVAFCWRDISPRLQQALCELIGIERDRAEELIKEDGFTIDMFGPDDPPQDA